MQLKGNEEVLDLGAGTGNINYFISAPCAVTSLDCSHAALTRLKAKFHNSTTVRSSLYHPLPFADATFDQVVSNNVLYTLPLEYWDMVVSEIRRVLKPNGRVVVSNLKVGFSPWKIYRDHIRLYRTSNGLLATGVHLMKLLVPTVQIFRYNRMIQRQEQTSAYTFLRDQHFQRVFFEQRGFKALEPSAQVYSGQAVLDILAVAS